MPETEREEGTQYWVQVIGYEAGGPRVAMWQQDCWQVLGFAFDYDDDEVVVLSSMLLPPEPEPEPKSWSWWFETPWVEIKARVELELSKAQLKEWMERPDVIQRANQAP